MSTPSSAVPAPPAAIVVFGASGDLAARKLVPAIHALAVQGLLDPSTWVIGVGRTDLGDDGWRAAMAKAVLGLHPAADQGPWESIAARARWVVGSFDDAATYQR
ncbi:MAG TPA: hypothetical protein VIH00_12765, partial [Candidatus Limnocylindrales bacterium]